MNTIGEQLKNARVKLGRSLHDIETATRISRKHLEQLEEGQTLSLPETYLRAFIKAYAQEVGISPAVLLNQIEAPSASKGSLHEISVATTASLAKQPRQLNILFTLSFMLCIGLFALIFWKQNGQGAQPIQEISFADVMKNTEQQPSSDEGPVFHENIPEEARADSLLLEGVASESVWVRIVADGVRAKEYNLAPRTIIRLKSKNYFSLSLDNAKAISFSLNGQKIGELATARRPLWNITLSRNLIHKLQTDLDNHEQKSQRQ